jgi:rfaE bifunctional protein nucleotidyltransferase chain/domain
LSAEALKTLGFVMKTLSKFPEAVKKSILLKSRVFIIENSDQSCYRLSVSGKLKSLEDLKVIAADARSKGRSVVFTNGCFDLLHRGHVHVLREAKACGDLLITGVNSDKSVKKIKGPARPVLPESDRSELLASLEMVDYVVLFDEPDPYELISAIRPNVLVKGGDWSDAKIVGADLVEEAGGRVVVIPYIKGFSTTEIIERIKNLDG